jgi:hypothetical protein
MHPSSHTIYVRDSSLSRTPFPCFQPHPHSREDELVGLLAHTVAYRRAQLHTEIPAIDSARSVS